MKYYNLTNKEFDLFCLPLLCLRRLITCYHPHHSCRAPVSEGVESAWHDY